MNAVRGSVAALALLCATPALADPVVLSAPERAQLAALEPLRGAALEAADLDGRAVVVTFFASWCPPCRAEFQHLNRIAEDFAHAPLAIVAVNVFEDFGGDDAARLARFLADTQPRFHVVEGDDAIKRTFGEVQRIPTVLVFDRAGRAVMHFIHARGARKMSATEEELRAAVTRALGG